MTELRGIRFNVTEDMNNAIIEMLLLKEMLLDKTLKKKDRVLLEKHLEELKIGFVTAFRENNKQEIKDYNDLMSQ